MLHARSVSDAEGGASCVANCTATPNCIGFTYKASAHACYLTDELVLVPNVTGVVTYAIDTSACRLRGPAQGQTPSWQKEHAHCPIAPSLLMHYQCRTHPPCSSS